MGLKRDHTRSGAEPQSALFEGTTKGRAIFQKSVACFAAPLPLEAVNLHNYCFDNFENASNLCGSSIEN